MFRKRGGDEILNDPMYSSSYLSPKIQNDLIEAIGTLTRKEILSKIVKAKYFGIIFDETTDIGKKEQLSLVVRYYDIEEHQIKENFIGFFDCFQEAKKQEGFADSLTGEVIGKIVINILEKDLKLDLNNLMSVGTDTCSVMASEERGAVAEIKSNIFMIFLNFFLEKAPNAIHSPCLNHILNLSVNKICAIPQLSFLLDTVEDVYNFFKYSV